MPSSQPCRISPLHQQGDGRPTKKRFKRYPIGYFHVDLAEVRTAIEGKLYLLIAIDRTSKVAVELTRFRGYLILLPGGGIHHATNPSRIPA